MSSEEEKKLPEEVQKEFLERAQKKGTKDISEVAAQLEGKIPQKPKDEE